MPIDRSRRTSDPRKAAEAAFRSVTTKPAAPAPTAPAAPAAVPGIRESVTLRLDSAVLEHFQKDGPGWQDRINDALRKLVGA
ncbi:MULTISPECIES: BrnA antitoxin family protein [Methylobacterium]|uniref:BrnA antitoxin family protein n=1 Tax=Methylobacterium TaxID=407 RepID=UPI00104D2753|nr:MULTISPECIES: BrnA antitoxin family protein [Methylobacterium]MDR7036956.1 uncharacterized protein (DUF4415 family) [Methylobacterium sp. BE186]